MTNPTFLQTGGTKVSVNTSATMINVNVGAGANKIGFYVSSIKASLSGASLPGHTGVQYNSNPGPGTAMTPIGSYGHIGPDNLPLTIEIWAVLLGSSTLVNGQILPTFIATPATTGNAAVFDVWQDCEQDLSKLITAWNALTPGTDDTDNTNSPPVSQTTALANQVMLSIAGWATSASLAVPAATAVNGDTLNGNTDLASRTGVALYSDALASPATHNFNTTFTNTWNRIRVAGTILSPVPSNTVGATDFGPGQVHQRSPSWTGANATVKFSGTYTGTTPDDIKIKVVQGAGTIVALTSLSSLVISGGTWSGTLSVPKGGGRTSGYTFTWQSMLSGGILVGPFSSSNSWGVGDIIMLCGSSSGEKMETDGGVLTPNANLGHYSTQVTSWITPSGDGLITFGNGIMGLNDGSPICIYNFAIGGSTLGNWAGVATGSDPDNPTVDGFWTSMIAIGAHALRWDVGTNSNDIRGNHIGGVTSGTQAQCETLWATYLARIDTNFGASTPMIHTVTQRMEVGGQGAASQRTWGVAAEMNSIDARPHSWYVQSVDYALRVVDSIHILVADMPKLAQRAVDIANTRIFSGSNPVLGPQPATAVHSGNNIVVTYTLNGAAGLVNERNDGSFTVPVSCFEVQNGSAVVQTINSATITSPTDITLAMAATPAAGWKVWALPGPNPSGAAAPGEPNLPAAKA